MSGRVTEHRVGPGEHLPGAVLLTPAGRSVGEPPGRPECLLHQIDAVGFIFPGWLASEHAVSARTRRFAKWSAIFSFALGMAG
jgi:hypothetical protein